MAKRKAGTDGGNWQFSEAKPPTQAPPEIIQQIAPEPKKSEIEFSFATDSLTKDNLTSSFDVMPDEKDQVKVPVTAIVVNEQMAKDVHLWFRICSSCKWISASPGFESESKEKPYDRVLDVPNMYPNVGLASVTLEIQLPHELVKAGNNVVSISTYYTCANCPVVNWSHPQLLSLKLPQVFKARSIPPYIPRPGH